MTGTAVLELIDAAPAFAEPQALSPDELRRAGLSALDQEIQRLRGAEGEARAGALQEAAQAAGSIIGAGALSEPFAKALLEDAAAAVGLLKEIGAKAVKATIAAALKAGKKAPRDFGHPMLSLPRPGEAGNSAAVRLSSSAEVSDPPDLPAAPAAARESDIPPDPSASSSSVAPAPPEGRSGFATSQTGDCADGDTGVGGGGRPPGRREDDGARNMRLAFFPLTDLGNAERFRERYRDKLLWCPAIGWLAWDGRRWSRDGADDLVKIAEHDTVRAIQDEADAVAESGDKEADDAPWGARDYVFKVDRDGNKTMYSDKIASWGRASEALNKLGALSKRGAPYFAVAIDKLDADKMMINVRNGTLVVRRRSEGDYVEFKPHDPSDLITKLAPVEFDPEAQRPAFDAFLAKVQPRDEMRSFIQQWLGLSLTGDVTEQLLAFFYGKGGNGKSVLIDAVSFVAGDYGETVPIETFLDHGKARGGGQATPDLAILPGVRFLRTSEPEKGAKLAEAMVKLVTGGEPIQARHLNRDFFKFYPQFKLTMSGNYRPTISGTDEGIWRRVRLVPFGITIPKEERDIHLHEKLRAEASGILNWLLDGLRVWIDKGLHEPEDVLQATAEYRSASDPLGRFLSQCIVDSIGDRVQSSVLHQVYEAWCASAGENAWKNRGFSLAMDERGYKRKQSDVVWWLDMKLVKSVNDFVDHEGKPIRVRNDGPKEASEGVDMEI
ncbi:phage/plasmid primase, P4 family [Azospirillum sp.]|uniref:DNA primase family protein n=1 Tax=Azospirillum sp. TaxID=34012 RepID=UPI002D527DED|nr:phage/plasmid primase, P4 family [Azospirillum sp.]HYD66109.1 phage/plasmid primase, P4 family [Azospirillum sp.]